jgi:hypothetical protein
MRESGIPAEPMSGSCGLFSLPSIDRTSANPEDARNIQITKAVMVNKQLPTRDRLIPPDARQTATGPSAILIVDPLACESAPVHGRRHSYRGVISSSDGKAVSRKVVCREEFRGNLQDSLCRPVPDSQGICDGACRLMRLQ